MTEYYKYVSHYGLSTAKVFYRKLHTFKLRTYIIAKSKTITLITVIGETTNQASHATLTGYHTELKGVHFILKNLIL